MFSNSVASQVWLNQEQLGWAAATESKLCGADIMLQWWMHRRGFEEGDYVILSVLKSLLNWTVSSTEMQG